MLTYEEVLNMNYYKKTSYTGWMEGMRFLIKKVSDPDIVDEATGEVTKKGDSFFQVWIWPGPYIYDLTPAEKKYTVKFPFTEEGRKQSVDWINEQFEAHMSEWPKRKTDGN